MIKYLVNMKRAEDMKQELIKVERSALIEFMNTIDADDFVEYNGIKCLEYHIKSLDQEDIQDVLDEMVELGYHVETVCDNDKLFCLRIFVTGNPGVFKKQLFKNIAPCKLRNMTDIPDLNYAHPSPYVYKDFRL